MFLPSVTRVSAIFFAISLESKAHLLLPTTLHLTDEFQQAVLTHENVDVNPFWLENILRIITGKQCYAIVRNFLNLDFIQTTVPLLTQYFEPMHDGGRSCDESCIFWIPAKFRSKHHLSEPLTILENNTCGSRYFLRYHWEGGWSICVTLNVTRWAFSQRLSNCKIVIDYGLPKLILQKEKYMNSYPYSENALWYSTPLTLQINVLIKVVSYPVDSEHQHSFENIFLLPNWAVRVSQLPP